MTQHQRRGDSFGWHSTNVVVSESGTQFWQGSLVRVFSSYPPITSPPVKFRCFRDDKDGEYYPFSYVTKKRYSAADLDACESAKVGLDDIMLIVAVTPHAVIIHHNETLYAVLRHWFVSDYFEVVARPST